MIIIKWRKNRFAFISVLIIAIMTKVTGLSQRFLQYKRTLREKGAMDIPRDIKIKAFNAASSSTTRDLKQDPEMNHIATKIVHFQRHGQGYHNLLGDHTRALGNDFNIDDLDPMTNPFVKPEIRDSPLTHKGRQEAAAARADAARLTPEVVVVSPLHRAIQTALISFADHYREGVPFVAHEGCREQLGLLTCNRALPLSQTVFEFPQVDFGLCAAGEEDALWQAGAREHPVDEANRAYAFLTEFLMRRPEKEVAVVCHSAWLFSVCNVVVDCGDDDFLESWFGTGEIRSVEMSFYKQ